MARLLFHTGSYSSACMCLICRLLNGAIAFTQVIVTVVLVIIQRLVGNNEQREYWIFFWIFFVQIINMSFFVYFFRRLLEKNDDKAVSDKTARMYARVLSRFAEYMYIYLIYMLLYLLTAMCTAVEIAGAMNTAWLVCSIPATCVASASMGVCVVSALSLLCVVFLLDIDHLPAVTFCSLRSCWRKLQYMRVDSFWSSRLCIFFSLPGYALLSKES